MQCWDMWVSPCSIPPRKQTPTAILGQQGFCHLILMNNYLYINDLVNSRKLSVKICQFLESSYIYSSTPLLHSKWFPSWMDKDCALGHVWCPIHSTDKGPPVVCLAVTNNPLHAQMATSNNCPEACSMLAQVPLPADMRYRQGTT